MRLPLAIGAAALLTAACSPRTATLADGTVVSDDSLARYARYRTLYAQAAAELKQEGLTGLAEAARSGDLDQRLRRERSLHRGRALEQGREALQQAGLGEREAAALQPLVAQVITAQVVLEESELRAREAAAGASAAERAEFDAQLRELSERRQDLPHRLEQARARYGGAAVEVVLRNQEPLAAAERAVVRAMRVEARSRAKDSSN